MQKYILHYIVHKSLNSPMHSLLRCLYWEVGWNNLNSRDWFNRCFIYIVFAKYFEIYRITNYEPAVSLYKTTVFFPHKFRWNISFFAKIHFPFYLKNHHVRLRRQMYEKKSNKLYDSNQRTFKPNKTSFKKIKQL